jgi:hypothetical protein
MKGLPIEVVEHASDPPSPWAGYLRCLEDIPDCSHLLIVQDDAAPVRNFTAAVRQIAAANPDAPVCLFLARLPRDASTLAARAMKTGRQRYVDLPWRSFLPVVAVLWPRHKAEEFRSWAESNPGLPGQREPRSDDAMAGRWKTLTRARVRVTVPSIVQHPDMEPSLIGRRRSWGQDSGRVAMFLADDALEYDWSAP